MHSVISLNQKDHNVTQLIQTSNELENVSQIQKVFPFSTDSKFKVKVQAEQQTKNAKQFISQQNKEERTKKILLILFLVIIGLALFTSILSLCQYLNLPALPISYNYVLSNWNSSPITSIFQQNNCEEELINYQFEGTYQGCDCTGSSLSSDLRVVQKGNCSQQQLQSGCLSVASVQAKILSSIKVNSISYNLCVKRIPNFTYQQSDCSKSNQQVNICGDTSTEESSLYALCVPQGYSCPINSIATSKLDTSFTQINNSPFFQTSSSYTQTHFISALVSLGNGICKQYNQQYYSTSNSFSYPLFIRSKSKCDTSDVDSRFQNILSISEDDFMSSNGLDIQIKNLPQYNYNSQSNLYFIEQQSYIPWKQVGSCRTNHMNTFINLKTNLTQINLFWLLSIIFSFALLSIFFILGSALLFILNRSTAFLKYRRYLIIAIVVFLIFHLFIQGITFIITMIFHSKINSMNSALCSDASTNSIISDFFSLWKNSYFTTQTILFIFICILAIEIIIFIYFLYEINTIQHPKIQDISDLNKQETVRLDINSQRLLQQEQITNKQSRLIIKKQYKSLHRSNSDIQGTLVQYENEFFREAHELRFQNEKQNIYKMSNFNQNINYNILNQNINSEQLVYKISNRLNQQQIYNLQQKYSYQICDKSFKIRLLPLKQRKNKLIYNQTDSHKIKLRKQLKKQIVFKKSNSIEIKRNSSLLFNPIEISDFRKELHLDEIQKKRQIYFIQPNQHQENKNNKIKNKLAKQGYVNNNDSILYLIGNSQSELNTNFSTPRIVSPLLTKKVETDLEEKQQHISNQNIINNINNLISVFNEDTQKSQQLQEPINNQNSIFQVQNEDTIQFQKHINTIQNLLETEKETKQKNKSSLEQLQNAQNQQKVYDYLNFNGGIKNLSSNQLSASKTDLNLKEISYLLQFQNNFTNKINQNEQISMQTSQVSPQNEKNQNNQFETTHQSSQNQTQANENKKQKNINSNCDSLHDFNEKLQKDKQNILKEDEEVQFNNSKITQIAHLQESTYQNNQQPEQGQKQKLQNQMMSNINNQQNEDVSQQIKQQNLLTPVKIYSKRGSLDHLEDQYQEKSRVKNKGLSYKKVKFFKRNVKVPMFSNPDFNDVKSRYLAFSSQESLSKMHRCGSSTKSRLDSPALKSKSRLQSLDIDEAQTYQISDFCINTKDLEQKEQNDYEQNLNKKSIIQLQKVEQENQTKNNNNLNNFISNQNYIKSSNSTQNNQVNLNEDLKELNFLNQDNQISKLNSVNQNINLKQSNLKQSLPTLDLKITLENDFQKQKIKNLNDNLKQNLLDSQSSFDSMSKTNRNTQQDSDTINNIMNQQQQNFFKIDSSNLTSNQIKQQPNFTHKEINYKLPQLKLNNKQQQNDYSLSPSRQTDQIKLPSLQNLKISPYYHQNE
ncbi:hypothetical protein ABPG74_018447 [Tetrahymena malaccensis]